MIRRLLPGRRDRGAGPRVPARTRVYAVGDIHGELDALRSLHRKILADAHGVRMDRKVVVYLGDYVDRGAKSRETLDLLIGGPLKGFEAIHLLGNHEAFVLRFLEDRREALPWLSNGGAETCESYGIDLAALPGGPERLAWLHGELTARLPKRHLTFLRSLRLSHVEGDFFFTHAGVRPDLPLDRQEASDLLWIREPFLSSAKDFGKVVVHGHTPTPKPVLHANRIGIDTGACYGGPLTALVLDGDQQYFLQS